MLRNLYPLQIDYPYLQEYFTCGNHLPAKLLPARFAVYVFNALISSMKPLHHLSDQELIREYQHDNLQALNCLISRYKDQVYTSIYLLVKDKELAEDIFQESFIRAIKSLKENRYNEKGMFLAWVIRISHNMYLDHLRKIKRVPAMQSMDGHTSNGELSISPDESDQSKTQEQRLEKIRHIILLLPEEQQEIIILRHYADLSFKQIAAVLNISINTALGRIRYALMNIRRIMKEKKISF